MKNNKMSKIFFNGVFLSLIVIFVCIALFQVSSTLNVETDKYSSIELSAKGKVTYEDNSLLFNKYKSKSTISNFHFVKLDKGNYEEYLMMKESDKLRDYELTEGRLPQKKDEVSISEEAANENSIVINQIIVIDNRPNNVVGVYKPDGEQVENIIKKLVVMPDTNITQVTFFQLDKSEFEDIKSHKTNKFEIVIDDGNNQREALLTLLKLIVYIISVITIFLLVIMIEYEIKKVLKRRKKNIFLLKSLGETNPKILNNEVMYFLKPFVIGVVSGLVIGTIIIPIFYNLLLGNFGGKSFYQFSYHNYPIKPILFGVLICFFVEFMLFYFNVSKSLKSVTLKDFYLEKSNNSYTVTGVLKGASMLLVFMLVTSLLLKVDVTIFLKIVIVVLIIMSILLWPIFFMFCVNRYMRGKLLFVKSFINTNQKKISSIILVFTSILTLQFVVISAVISSLNTVNEGWKVILTGDGFAINPSMEKMDPQVLSDIKGIGNLYVSTKIYPTDKLFYKGESTNGFMIKGTDIAKYKSSVEGEVETNGILVGKAISMKLGISIGEYVTFKGHDLPVSGITSSGENGGDIIYIDPDMFKFLFAEEGSEIVTFDIINEREFYKSLEGKGNVFYFRTNEEYIQTGIKSVYSTLAPIVALDVIVAVLGILIIMLMLSDLVHDNRKSIILLRSLGSRRRELFKENLMVLCIISGMSFVYSLVFTQLIAEHLNRFIVSMLGSIVEINVVNGATFTISFIILVIINLVITIINTIKMNKVSIANEVKIL